MENKKFKSEFPIYMGMKHNLKKIKGSGISPEYLNAASSKELKEILPTRKTVHRFLPTEGRFSHNILFLEVIYGRI